MVELTVNDMNHSLPFPLHKGTELSWTFEAPYQIKVTAFSIHKKQIFAWQFEQVALCIVDLSAEQFFAIFTCVLKHLSSFLQYREELLLIQDGAGGACVNSLGKVRNFQNKLK